ncbi:hypothetical protein [Saccharopolyspora spinosa]|uniref:hypothetical protein n=1 Tax=Saccharopolyspora spinosa TaxID=60894 RepID=UPI001ED9435B|nr:hypothetical protein [Saccharopolyspora spinosa]
MLHRLLHGLGGLHDLPGVADRDRALTVCGLDEQVAAVAQRHLDQLCHDSGLPNSHVRT